MKGKVILIFLTGTIVGALFFSSPKVSKLNAQFTWSEQQTAGLTPPRYFTAWMRPIHENISGCTWFYINDQGDSIYSNSMSCWKNGVFTKVWTSGTTGSNGSSCNPMGPRDRHPLGQQVVDTRRHKIIMFGGPNQTCGSPQDWWEWSLNADPTTDVWTQRSNPAHFPLGNFELGCAYNSNVDVTFCFGSGDSSVLCETDLNPTPGTFTANQTAAGCVNADDWTNITTTGTKPTNDFFPGAAYDSVHDKIGFLGAFTAGPSLGMAIELSTYDVLTKHWTIQTPTGTPPLPNQRDQNIVGVPWDLNTNDGRFYYFEPDSDVNGVFSWKYGDVAWKSVCIACTPFSGSPSLPMGFNTVGLAYDSNQNALVMFSNASTGIPPTFDAGDIVQGLFLGGITHSGKFSVFGR